MCITFHGGRKQAEAELTRLLREMDTGEFQMPSKITIERYLLRWLETVAAPRVGAKTLQEYQKKIQAYVLPNLGKMPLMSLRPQHLEQLYCALLDRRLSPRSVYHVHSILHNALQHAVKQQLLRKNVASLVDAPSVPKRERKILSPQQAITLLDATEGTLLHLPVLIALLTGLRRGEIVALRWGDVDTEGKTLAVNWSVSTLKGGEPDEASQEFQQCPEDCHPRRPGFGIDCAQGRAGGFDVTARACLRRRRMDLRLA